MVFLQHRKQREEHLKVLIASVILKKKKIQECKIEGLFKLQAQRN